MEEKSTAPLMLGFLALLALVSGGIAVRPLQRPTAEPPAARPLVRDDGTQAFPSASPKTTPELCAVADFFGRPSDGPRLSEEAQALLERADAQGYEVSALIALVPHPTRSHLASMFDQHLQAIQRALEDAEYLLDRHWLPWTSSAPPPESKARPSETSSPRKPCASDAPEPPGALLFRSARSGAEGKKLLLLLLVPESPTSGIDKPAFATALDLATGLQEAGSGPAAAQRREVRILGPTFSGSVTSLKRGLVLWARERLAGPRTALSFNIVSGSLTDADSGLKLRSAEDWPAELKDKVKLSFATTLYTDEYVIDLFLHYLQNRDSAVPATSCPASIDHSRDRSQFMRKVALLVEANTGYGQSVLAPQEGTGGGAGATPATERTAAGYLKIPFPMHIAQLRAEWGKAASVRTARPGVPMDLPPLALELPTEEGHGGDVIAPYSKLSSRIDDLVLGNVLSAISRHPIAYVGLVATDVQDRLFLGKVVHEHCPDVTLFTIGADLLYTHPQYAHELEGMLLASTYPLFTQNQVWTYPHRGRERTIQFATNEAEGVFNATLALLGRNGQMIEYGIPLEKEDAPPRAAPPVWISAVGRGAIWPVAAVCLREELDPLLLANPRPPGEKDAFHPAEKTISSPTFFKVYGIGFVLFCLFHAGAYQVISRRKPAWPVLWRVFAVLEPSREARRRFVQRLYLFASFLVLSVVYAWITVPWLLRFLNDWRAQQTFEARFALVTELLVIALGWVALYVPIGHLAYTMPRTSPSRGTLPLLAATGVLGSLLPLALVVTTVIYAFGSPRDLVAGSPVEPAWLAAFYLRASSLASGLSPLLPMLFLGLALYLWSLAELRRLHLGDGARDYSAAARLGGVGETGLPVLKEKIDGLLDDSVSNLWACLGLFVVVTVFFWVSLGWLPPSIDGRYFVRLFEVLLFLVCVAIAFEFGRFVLVWQSLKRMLRRFAWHPSREALMRMPEVVSSEPLLDMTRARPSLGMLKAAIERWEALAGRYRAPGKDAGGREIGRVEVDTGEWARLDQALGPELRAVQAELQDTLDAEAHRPWEVEGGKRALQGRVDRAQCAVADALEAARRAGGSWVPAADDFVAMGIVSYIRYVFAHLRNQLVFATVAILLVLLAISCYPFQPKHLLLTLSWIAILSMVTVTVVVFVEMARDEVLSWLTKTRPGHVVFSREFVSRLATYGLVPVLGLAAAQFPEVGRFFFFWVEPFLNAFK